MLKALALLVLGLGSGGAKPIDTVPDLDVTRYMGRWYQVYTDKINALTFERNNVCVTADYALMPEGGIVAVHNAANLGTPDGEISDIEGTAIVVDPSEPGKLAVSLDGAPSGADYWVVALDEDSAENEPYQWAVVTDRLRATLFILARDPQDFAAQYEEMVLGLVEDLGFTSFLNKPLKVRHEGCTYDGHEPPFAFEMLQEQEEEERVAIDTVDEVDVSAYTGRWYQMYANYIVQYTFELGGKCATADYSAIEAGISVKNSQNLIYPDGPLTSITGKAYAKDDSEPGQLTVEFDNIPFPGSYWLIKLGPIINGQYQYAVVTDKYAATLFVLARDVKDFEVNYKEEVLEFVTPLFTGFLRKPRASVQGPECEYSEPSSSSSPIITSSDFNEEDDQATVNMRKRNLLRH